MDAILRFRLIAGGLCLGLLGALVWSIVRASLDAAVVVGLERIAADPWGLATLVDIYLGLVVVALWLWCVERRPWSRALWIPALFLLGNLVTAVVLLLRLRHARDLREWLLRPLPGDDGGG